MARFFYLSRADFGKGRRAGARHEKRPLPRALQTSADFWHHTGCRSAVLVNKEDVARFRREVEAAANLNRPNLIPIHEVGNHGGQHYFRMKLIEGGTLCDQMEPL